MTWRKSPVRKKKAPTPEAKRNIRTERGEKTLRVNCNSDKTPWAFRTLSVASTD